MDDKIPNSLLDALKNKQVIPFVGAGVSRAVEKRDKNASKSFDPLFPNWKEYVQILAQTLRDENKSADGNLVEAYVNIPKPKYLEAMQHAYDELPNALWYKNLNDHFKRDENEAAPESLELPRLIWELGSNIVFTTNIDRVLQWKAVKDAEIEAIDTQEVELGEILQDEKLPPTLLYLHGRVGNKNNIIFTQKQYDDFYKHNKNQAKLHTLWSFLARKSLLFVGFSLDDTYFVEQLNFIHEIYKGGSPQYYALIKKSEKGSLGALGFVTEIYYEDFGEPLLKVLREMCDVVNEYDTPAKTPTVAKNNLPVIKTYNEIYERIAESLKNTVGSRAFSINYEKANQCLYLSYTTRANTELEHQQEILNIIKAFYFDTNLLKQIVICSQNETDTTLKFNDFYYISLAGSFSYDSIKEFVFDEINEATFWSNITFFVPNNLGDITVEMPRVKIPYIGGV